MSENAARTDTAPETNYLAWKSRDADNFGQVTRGPDGRLVLRVPGGESPWGRMHQHGDLTHCSTLGVSKFPRLAAPLGPEVDPVGEAHWHALQHAGRSPKTLLRALLSAATPGLHGAGQSCLP